MSFTSAARAVSGAALAGALLLGVAPAASADEIRDEQWALEAFDVEKVWQESTGEDVTVAVLDDPVNGDHPDLRKNVLPGKDMVNGGPANKETNEDHGTSMAALIAAHGHGSGNKDGVVGLAPDAKILPVGLSIPQNDQDGEYISFAEGMRYAVDEGASVINISIAGRNITAEEEQAVAYAASKDVLIVAGSGNKGGRGLGFPARAPGVVGVGAITEAGNVWEDSTYGPELMLTAPGERIQSAAASQPYQLASGTSSATAYVSGAAALLRAKFPDLSAGQIVNRLVKTALMPEAMGKGHDEHYGHGMIRPYRALTEDIPAGAEKGPLKEPEATLSPEPGAGKGEGSSDNKNDNAGNNQASDDDGMTTSQLAGIGIAGLSVVALIVGAIIFFKKRGNRSNDPPPPGNWGGPGGGPGNGPGGGQAPPPQYMPPQPPAPGQYHQPGPGPYPQNQPPQGPPGY